MAESARQKRITGRVMHEFKHGELKSGPGGKGGPAKSRRQAVAIALKEAGASKYESGGSNKRNLHRTERKKPRARPHSKSARGNRALAPRTSARARARLGARMPLSRTARGGRAANARAHQADGHTATSCTLRRSAVTLKAAQK
jgi:Family of unknown function (DUF6496)